MGYFLGLSYQWYIIYFLVIVCKSLRRALMMALFCSTYLPTKFARRYGRNIKKKVTWLLEKAGRLSNLFFLGSRLCLWDNSFIWYNSWVKSRPGWEKESAELRSMVQILTAKTRLKKKRRYLMKLMPQASMADAGRSTAGAWRSTATAGRTGAGAVLSSAASGRSYGHPRHHSHLLINHPLLPPQ